MKPSLTREPYALAGQHDGLRGDCSGLSGDLDACDISDSDRQAIVNIVDLVAQTPL